MNDWARCVAVDNSTMTVHYSITCKAPTRCPSNKQTDRVISPRPFTNLLFTHRDERRFTTARNKTHKLRARKDSLLRDRSLSANIGGDDLGSGALIARKRLSSTGKRDFVGGPDRLDRLVTQSSWLSLYTQPHPNLHF